MIPTNLEPDAALEATLVPEVPAPATAARQNSEAAANLRMLQTARRVRELSVKTFGAHRPVELVGRSPAMAELLRKIQKFARFNEPILIMGESGVGKEFIASACHLLSRRVDRPFVSINCPQYQEGNLTVSELFGHEKGSFTGAIGAHKGVFETADSGAIFLDEVGDLPLSAQTMLLRALAEKEFKSLGSTTVKHSDVRVVAATNRPLRQMMVEGTFRSDLYFRLRYFPLQIPPLREREDDWRLLLEHFLAKLNDAYGQKKAFSAASLRLLGSYHWPGNVRELKSLVAMAYSLSDAKLIEPCDFVGELSEQAPLAEAGATLAGAENSSTTDDLYQRLTVGKENFWEVVQHPFLERDLNRAQVRTVIQQGLTEAHGSYRKMAALFQVNEDSYQKLMDFLRHHRLKPSA